MSHTHTVAHHTSAQYEWLQSMERRKKNIEIPLIWLQQMRAECTWRGRSHKALWARPFYRETKRKNKTRDEKMCCGITMKDFAFGVPLYRMTSYVCALCMHTAGIIVHASPPYGANGILNSEDEMNANVRICSEFNSIRFIFGLYAWSQIFTLQNVINRIPHTTICIRP